MVDPSDDRQIFPDIPFGEIPHGKQSWYGLSAASGRVFGSNSALPHLFAVSAFSPQPVASVIIVATTLSGALPAGATLHATVYDPDGLVVAEADLDATGHGQAQLDGPPAL